MDFNLAASVLLANSGVSVTGFQALEIQVPSESRMRPLCALALHSMLAWIARWVSKGLRATLHLVTCSPEKDQFTW